MRALAYEGHFENGRFYAAGKTVKIPEKQRVVVTILDDVYGDDPAHQLENAPRPVRNIGFMAGAPLPDSFFEPLPEEELELWGL